MLPGGFICHRASAFLFWAAWPGGNSSAEGTALCTRDAGTSMNAAHEHCSAPGKGRWDSAPSIRAVPRGHCRGCREWITPGWRSKHIVPAPNIKAERDGREKAQRGEVIDPRSKQSCFQSWKQSSAESTPGALLILQASLP